MKPNRGGSLRQIYSSMPLFAALQSCHRTIDIDILLYDDLTISESNLKIPHPLMYERDFVMKPLNEILE